MSELHLSYESGSDVWKVWTDNKTHLELLSKMGLEVIEGSCDIPKSHLRDFKHFIKARNRPGYKRQPFSV